MNKLNVTNAALFQLTWFGCVLGGANASNAWGLIGVTALVLFSVRQDMFRQDLILIVSLAVLGWMLDSLWIRLGVLDYQTDFAPPWIVLLWVAVALTINHSLAWFKEHPLIGATFAGAAAPLCYLGGERLGAVIVPSAMELGWVVTAWFVVFFFLFWQKASWQRIRGVLT